jgi:hypothetical protein
MLMRPSKTLRPTPVPTASRQLAALSSVPSTLPPGRSNRPELLQAPMKRAAVASVRGYRRRRYLEAADSRFKR